jgi:hypothetical protein
MTATEFLLINLLNKFPKEMEYLFLLDANLIEDILSQAKEMEKQQIIDAQSYAISKADMTNNRGFFDCEQYYEETFNK